MVCLKNSGNCLLDVTYEQNVTSFKQGVDWWTVTSHIWDEALHLDYVTDHAQASDNSYSRTFHNNILKTAESIAIGNYMIKFKPR